MKKRIYYTTDTIKNEFNKIHSQKYDYSKFVYTKMHDKSTIICPMHGEFEQSAHAHLKGQGCPKCGLLSRSQKRMDTTKTFIEKAKLVHGDKYDYSKVEYVNSQTKVCIICPEHGEFWMTPHSHSQGQGCPKCYNNKRKIIFNSNTEQFIERAREIHGKKYDYSKVKYINSITKVCIICSEHGEFWMTPSVFLNQKSGCPLCGKILGAIKRKQTSEQFIEKAKLVHGNKYDYSKTVYENTNTKIRIICPEHGEFWQYPYYHLDGCGCQQCAKEMKSSKYEYEILQFLKEKGVSVKKNNRKLISPYEIDIFIPDKKIGIEFNGIYWHNENNQPDKNYHLNKLNRCNEKGVKLIQIFEDEYVEHKDIVLNKICHLLKKDDNKEKVIARKCEIKVINKDLAKEFLTQNHIQGYVPSTVYLGCFHDNNLVGVMTFKKESKEGNKWEMNSFATDITKHCIGVGGKLFSYFIKTYNPIYIKSFADRRWTLDKDDNLYTNLGFKLTEILKPDYRYVNGLKREHKFGYRKQTLIKKYPDENLDMNMTEKQMCDKLGFYRIWDCGLFKYEWKI